MLFTLGYAAGAGLYDSTIPANHLAFWRSGHRNDVINGTLYPPRMSIVEYRPIRYRSPAIVSILKRSCSRS